TLHSCGSYIDRRHRWLWSIFVGCNVGCECQARSTGKGRTRDAMDQDRSSGIDLTAGYPLEEIADGSSVVGHVGDASVLVVRRGAELFAVDALCTHYHGPLAEGLVVRDTVRCPWHHACFDLRTGE